MSPLLGFSFFSDLDFARLQILLKKYSPEQVWTSFTAQDLQQLRLKPPRSEEILRFRDTFAPATYQDRLRLKNITALDYYAPEYPALLKEIYDPPLVLYKKGALGLAGCSGLAVVGTRHPDSYGRQATADIVRALGRNTIVSGMALGIDTAAHQAALETSLPTIAVLGTPVDNCYPADNQELYERIIKEGAILSEYPPGAPYTRWSFPRRNRIITGLSRAVFVIEGRLTSGALISGKIALEQNREVYALPGQLGNPLAEGPNWLIAQGARPIYDLNQLCLELGGSQLSLDFPRPVYTLTAQEDQIYARIPADGTIAMDTLLENFEFGHLSKTLLQMEIKGLISILPGKQVIRI
ncbi:MAG: DNA-processing protein DprA [Candidatus Margulisbacteria bacterium]|jgi:DNA processing protein|nr:DNA-processing protein DprA [Candidatus Margulisiibacteriota bacterium]